MCNINVMIYRVVITLVIYSVLLVIFGYLVLAVWSKNFGLTVLFIWPYGFGLMDPPLLKVSLIIYSICIYRAGTVDRIRRTK